MKRLFALLMAAALLLAAVPALAAGGQSVSIPIATAPPREKLASLSTVGLRYETASANGAAPYSDATVAALTETLGELSRTRDVFGLDLSRVFDIGPREVEFEFATEYMYHEAVSTVLVVVHGNAVSEYVLGGEVIEDYVVAVTFPADVLAATEGADATFLCVVTR